MNPAEETIKASREPEPWPLADEGWHDAVLVDWYLTGRIAIGRHMGPGVALVWQLAQRSETGRRIVVRRVFHASLQAASHLRRWVERWQGRPLTDYERYEVGVWFETWIGRPCRLRIRHVDWQPGRPWIQPVEVQPWDQTCGRLPLTPERYRRKPREHWPVVTDD